MISRIHHVALRTRDVPRLEQFYVELLGLAPERRDGDRSVWLAAGDTLLMIERAMEGEPEIPRGSMELVAFAIAPAMRASFREKLSARGVPIEGETPHTLYFRDPDGRRVALSHYPEPPA